MKHQTSFVKRALSSIIALLIAIPPSYAGTIGSTSDDSILEKAPGRSAWTYLAEKLYEGETDPEMMREKETLSSLLFADYLDYLNAIGIELASYEISLQGKKEISERGECSDETLKSYNKLLADSAGSIPNKCSGP